LEIIRVYAFGKAIMLCLIWQEFPKDAKGIPCGQAPNAKYLIIQISKSDI